MAGLHLRLNKDEKMIVNGAAMHFLTETEFRFTNSVRFVYGRQLMAPSDAHNTARRLYLAIQNAYIGEPHESAAAMTEAELLIDLYREATTSPTARAVLDRIRASARTGDFYAAMRAARRLVRHEDAVLASVGEHNTAESRVLAFR